MEPSSTKIPLERTWRNKLYSLWDVGLIFLDEKSSTLRSHLSLWLQQCPHGPRLITAGHCSFKAKRAGSIRLGTKVRFQAYWRSNRVGLTNQVIIQTLDDGIVEIGNNSGGSSIVISAMNRVTIGNNVRIGGNVRIFDHDFHSLDMVERTTLPLHQQNIRNAPVVIGDGVFIGTGAMILKGTKIGENSIIGAGAVVSGLIPPGEIWVGNPARFVKNI
jgi:acetyltransferase-like isoleucine patch superfamily enzyme